jgi:hypothetical protein
MYQRCHHRRLTLQDFGVLHCQQCERRFETRQRGQSLSPSDDVRPAMQVERADFGKGYIAVAEQIRNGWLGSTEIAPMSELGVQYRQRRLSTSAMVIGDRRLNADWKKFLLTEVNTVAIEDRWKQDIDAPVQPLPHSLARRGIGALELVQRLGQMLDDGCRLEVDAFVVDENRDLPHRESAKSSGVLCIPFWKLT